MSKSSKYFHSTFLVLSSHRISWGGGKHCFNGLVNTIMSSLTTQTWWSLISPSVDSVMHEHLYTVAEWGRWWGSSFGLSLCSSLIGGVSWAHSSASQMLPFIGFRLPVISCAFLGTAGMLSVTRCTMWLALCWSCSGVWVTGPKSGQTCLGIFMNFCAGSLVQV